MVGETDQLCTAEFAFKDNKALLQLNAFVSCYSPIWLAGLLKAFPEQEPRNHKCMKGRGQQVYNNPIRTNAHKESFKHACCSKWLHKNTITGATWKTVSVKGSNIPTYTTTVAKSTQTHCLPLIRKASRDLHFPSSFNFLGHSKGLK